MYNNGSQGPRFASITAAIEFHAARRPRAPALIDIEPHADDQSTLVARLSYQELHEATLQWAARLSYLGANKNGAVALLLPNTAAHYVLMLAAGIASASLSLNPLQSVEYLAGLLVASRTNILVVPTRHDDEKLSLLGAALLTMIGRNKLTLIETGASPWGNESLAAQTGTAECRLGSELASDPVAWFHTGGTTGVPKLVRHSHLQHVLAAEAFASAAAITEADCLANGLPLFHVAGAICSTRALWLRGGCVVNLSRQGFRNPLIVEQYWTLLQKHAVTIAGGVPTAVASVLNRPVNVDLSALRCGYAGGAPCGTALQQHFARQTGRPLHIIYGMTECCGVIAVGRTDRLSPPGTIGPVVSGLSVEIRDAYGKQVPNGCHGEIWVSGPTVVSSSSDVSVGDWMPTGDRGLVVADELIVNGRISDMIIRSGHNIDPAIIEDAALRTGKIAAAVAIGQPDAYAGEVPILYVVAESRPAFDSAALLAEISSSLADRAARPRAIYPVAVLPMTQVGKVDRRSLKADAIERILRQTTMSLFGIEPHEVLVKDPQGLRPEITIDWAAPAPNKQQTLILREWADEHNLELL